MSETPAKNRVLLIGWDGADWKVIHPLMDQGTMPNLKRLIANGVMGNIATMQPMFSPMLWTSIATGKRPYKHGVLNFVEPSPDGMGVRPISSTSRKTKAIWNIFDQSQLKSNVIGWWPSYPVEAINGVMVSDHYAKVKSQGMRPDDWPLEPKHVHPESIRETLKDLRKHPSDVPPDLIRNFIPLADHVDQTKDNRLFQCMKIVCECSSIHAAAKYALRRTDWDFMAVYYDAIDHFSHGFMRFHPPRLETVKEKDFEIYNNVVRAGYVYHDMMLGALMRMVDKNTNIILMSDHGFHSDDLRPKHVPAEPAGPAIEHREFGIFVASGPGIKQDSLLFGTTLLDIAPTVLHMFGLPVGKDMDGRVLHDMFESPREVQFVDSWDEIGPELASVLPGGQEEFSYQDTQQALQQLVELGYVEELDGSLEDTVKSVVDEIDFNRARSYVDAGMDADALPILVELYNSKPSEYRFGIHLAVCLQKLQHIDDLEKLVRQLNERRKLDAGNSHTKIAKYEAVMRERIGDLTHGGEEQAQQPRSSKQMLDTLSKDEKRELLSLKTNVRVNHYALRFFEGFVLVAKQKYQLGIQKLKEALDQGGPRPSIFAMIGDALLQSRDAKTALQAFDKGLQIDPHNATLYAGKALALYRMKDNEQAETFVRKAVGLRYFYPKAHYILGCCLQRLRRADEAAKAFEQCIEQAPNYTAAHTRLARVYQQSGKLSLGLSHLKMADAIRQKIVENRRQHQPLVKDVKIDLDKELEIIPETNHSKIGPDMLPGLRLGPSQKDVESWQLNDSITIVSGLPRSGTSMMMQMLAAAGLSIYTDDKRLADEDNPNGYLEAESIKGLIHANRFVTELDGQVLKVVAPLLAYLPAGPMYRVLFMDRNIDEIIESQKKMLERQEAEHADIEFEKLSKILIRQKVDAVTLLQDKNIPFMLIPYAAVIRNPIEAGRRINRFLGGEIDESAMTQTIDDKLYRNRAVLSENSTDFK